MSQVPPNLREADGSHHCGDCAAYSNGVCKMYDDFTVDSQQVCDAWTDSYEKIMKSVTLQQIGELIPTDTSPQVYQECVNVWNKVYSDWMDTDLNDEVAQQWATLAVKKHLSNSVMKAVGMKFRKFGKITKIDAVNHTVTGIITNEAPDAVGEIFDYDSSLPYYKSWSANAAETTSGKSLGNIREMHQLNAVGKLVELNFDDITKEISGTAKIVDPLTWIKCEEGVLTGFSHGGEYIGPFKKDGPFKRYTASPSEVSVVDLPANPDAVFQFIRADGTSEMRKFISPPKESVEDMTREETTELFKTLYAEATKAHPTTDPIAAADLAKKEKCRTCGALVDDCKCAAKITKTSPKFSKAVNLALTKAIQKIHSLTDEQVVKITPLLEAHLTKGMNHLAQLADVILEVAWLKWSVTEEQAREGDEASPLPEDLQDSLTSLASTLVAMAGEEARELVANSGEGKPPDEIFYDSLPFFCASEPSMAKGVKFFRASIDISDYDNGYAGYQTAASAEAAAEFLSVDLFNTNDVKFIDIDGVQILQASD